MSTSPPKAHRAEAPTDIITNALKEAKTLFQKCGGLDIDTIKARYLELIKKRRSLEPLFNSDLELGYFAAAVHGLIERGLPWDEPIKQKFVNLFKKPGAPSLLDLARPWSLSKDSADTVWVISESDVLKSATTL